MSQIDFFSGSNSEKKNIGRRNLHKLLFLLRQYFFFVKKLQCMLLFAAKSCEQPSTVGTVCSHFCICSLCKDMQEILADIFFLFLVV